MSPSQALLTLAVIWLAVGLTASIVMGRRGHDRFTWLVVGAGMGPLAIPLAIRSVRAERRSGSEPRTVMAGDPGGGDLDVLVGIDGSDRSIEALRVARELLAERIGRLTLAGVIDLESAASPRPGGAQERMEATLDRAAGGGPPPRPSIVVLSGAPATTLVGHALDHGYRLLVVGRRGRGASKRLLGSTASALADEERIPVLIV